MKATAEKIQPQLEHKEPGAEMLTTSGIQSLAGAQATTRAAEMPETVLTPTTREFSQISLKTRQNIEIS